MNNECWIRFASQVTPQSSQSLYQYVDQFYNAGVHKINILIDTPGGSVPHGIALYNYLVGLPINISTHNFGAVDSIGLIIFLAGKERYSVPNARFLLHLIAGQVPPGVTIDENWLLENTRRIENDQQNIARIISANSKLEVQDALNYMKGRQVLFSEQALEKGIVTEIKSELIPRDAQISPVYEITNPPISHPPLILQPSNTSNIYTPNTSYVQGTSQNPKKH